MQYGKFTLKESNGMVFEGFYEEVLDALFTKRNQLKENYNNTKIRPLLIVLTGVMRGVDGAGRVITLDKHNLINSFDNIIGISTGAGIAAYALSKQAKLGASIYYEECLDIPLISLKRAIGGGYLTDIHAIANVLRYGPKSIDQKIIKQSRVNIFSVVTEKLTGNYKLLNLKDLNDIVDGVEASFAIVGASDSVFINGIEYIDGGLAMPFPPREIIKKLNPTHILVITNKIIGEKMIPLYKLIGKWMVKDVKHLKGYVSTWHDRFDKYLNSLRNDLNIPYLIAWAGNDISPLTTNKQKLIKATNQAEKHMEELIKKYSNASINKTHLDKNRDTVPTRKDNIILDNLTY